MIKRGYEGLVGYDGLDILLSTAFPRPVHIVRQFISNLDMGISPLSAYHANKGLSSMPPNGGGSRRIDYIPGRITNPISGIWWICGYEGLKV
jgi:hypothetical protein